MRQEEYKSILPESGARRGNFAVFVFPSVLLYNGSILCLREEGGFPVEDQTHDRFFKILMVGVVVLAVLAVAVGVIRQRRLAYRTDDTPSAAVYNFLLALHRADWARAYDLLADTSCRPDEAAFEEAFSGLTLPQVVLRDEGQSGDRAWVKVEIGSRGAYLGSEGVRWRENVALRRGDGRWKIVQLPYPLWPLPPMDSPYTEGCDGGR